MFLPRIKRVGIMEKLLVLAGTESNSKYQMVLNDLEKRKPVVCKYQC